MIITPRFFGAGAGGEGFSPQLVSVDFAGGTHATGEHMANTTDQAIGIANSWSIAVWFKPDTTTNQDDFLDISPAGFLSNSSSITISFGGNLTNDPIQVIIRATSTGSTIKDYRWNSLVTAGAWQMSVVTWDGTTLSLVHNGSDQGAPDSAPVNTTGTQADDNRAVIVGALDGGATFDGRIHSVGVWNTVLSEAVAAVLYNAGEGSEIDWSSNSGSYTAASNLKHWWRLGNDSSDIGKDSGNGALIDIDTNSVDITSDDIVADYPGA